MVNGRLVVLSVILKMRSVLISTNFNSKSNLLRFRISYVRYFEQSDMENKLTIS